MSKQHRDYQQSKLYRWENTIVGSKDMSQVPYDNIQNIVNYIWEGEGLLYPPTVVPKPKQKTTAFADATRMKIRFDEHRTTPTWIIIHEVAHSMTSNIDGISAKHGPHYLGVYMKLLDKYIPGVSLSVLMYTAKEAGLDFDIMAGPIITD